MSEKYQNLLSPAKVGNVVFRNRLTAARSSPRFVQGSESYPTEALITHYANKAKNGAAMVTCGGVGMPHNIPANEVESFSAETILPGSFNIYEANCQNYLSQLADAIHFYGAKASMQIGGYVPAKYDVSSGIPFLAPLPGTIPRVGEEVPADLLDEVAEDFGRQAALMKDMGFDMVYLHMAYRFQLLGRFLSPLTNKRTDQYGGSLENQARFPLMAADRIKQKCGKDFLIEASISGCEPPGGRTLEETIELAKMFAGHIDMLQIRAQELDPAHPAGFNLERTPFLYMAEAVKKSGADITVVTVGGYLDLDTSEDVIASGKADFIAMARGWISNPNYGRLAYEGRNEDIVPCIRCNMCLRGSLADPPNSVCSVNPIWGLEHKIERMIQPPTDKKKVAIVGGGPAGLEAAHSAWQNGHRVTLLEENQTLGGQLNLAASAPGRSEIENLRQFLLKRLESTDVAVMTGRKATSELIRQHRERALTPDRPVLRGTAQNPDAFFQSREAPNPYYAVCAGKVQEVMDRFAERTGLKVVALAPHASRPCHRAALPARYGIWVVDVAKPRFS